MKSLIIEFLEKPDEPGMTSVTMKWGGENPTTTELAIAHAFAKNAHALLAVGQQATEEHEAKNHLESGFDSAQPPAPPNGDKPFVPPTAQEIVGQLRIGMAGGLQ